MAYCRAPIILLYALCLPLLFLCSGEPHRDVNTDSRFFFEAQRNGLRHKRKMVDALFLWPNKTIPYTFLDPPPDRAAVRSGVQHWQQHTCLQFVHTSDVKQPHIAFRKLSGCRSGVGRELPLGQNVSIGDTCTRLGIVVHEIGHAIGFYHEIRRPDRDQHVIINSGNILDEELFNFHKLQWIDTSVKYDLSSVMHYTPMEWTANGRTSVATRDPMLQGVLGMWKGTSDRGLSHRDKLLANTVYGCIGSWVSSCGLQVDPCEGEGYLGASCRCICPPGTEGPRCQRSAGGYYGKVLFFSNTLPW
ncbi:Peptidase M12A [Trinorchestia longiramus]|nr:Peptidase M12A [Trinorchestia longiramus]